MFCIERDYCGILYTFQYSRVVKISLSNREEAKQFKTAKQNIINTERAAPFTHSPISASALAGEIHPMIGVIILLIHNLREAEVRDLDLAAHVALREQDVARLQVVVDDRRLDLVQVLEGRHHLHHDGTRLALRDRLVLEWG